MISSVLGRLRQQCRQVETGTIAHSTQGNENLIKQYWLDNGLNPNTEFIPDPDNVLYGDEGLLLHRIW